MHKFFKKISKKPIRVALILLMVAAVDLEADPVAYQIVNQDGNSRVWQREIPEQTADGKTVLRTHSYTELATGLNYQDAQGKWQPAEEKITILPDGRAAALRGQHKVYFPVDIYNGVITLVMPGGQVMESQPAALSYSDKNNVALIAVLTNSIGQLVGDNQVIYPHAFVGIDADLRYTYTKAGFEQDVILHEQPPAPASLGLNATATKLEVMTEFFNTRTPALVKRTFSARENELVAGEDLNFGTMAMVPGKAFLLGNESKRAQVSKSWVKLQGRQFLLEEVLTAEIADELDALPASPALSSIGKGLPVLAKEWILPPQHLAKATIPTKFIQLANMNELKGGYVLDYVAVNSNQTNYIFQGGMTYYVSGAVNFSGTTIFEGGAVIKYAPANPTTLTPKLICAKMLWQGSEYHPTIFTAVDDNSVGEVIAGSTGNPGNGVNYADPISTPATNYYGWPAVESYSAFTASNFRMTYIGIGLECDSSSLDVTNAQFINCRRGTLWFYYGGIPTAFFQNVLTVNSYECSDGYNYSTAHGSYQALNYNVQNATFFNTIFPVNDENYTAGVTNCNFYLTNCIFANCNKVSNDPSQGWLIYANHNGFYSNNPTYFPDFGGNPTDATTYPFKTAVVGHYYLTNSSPFRNVGTTNIDSVLLANLAAKTTCPPIVYTNVTFTNAMIFLPQVSGDNDGMPDLGYHYDRLDYLVSGDQFASNLMAISAGVAIGWLGNGFVLTNGQSITFNGTLENPCYFVRASSVLEQDFSGAGIGLDSLSDGNSLPTVNATFTRFSALGNNPEFFAPDLINVTARDCEFWAGSLGGSSISNKFTLNLTNCLIDRSYSQFEIFSNADYYEVSLQNCTAHGGILGLTIHNSATPGLITFNNDAFDGTSISAPISTNIICSNNAYLSGVTHLPNDTNDIATTNFNWQTSWFGNYYLPVGSLLIDHGSTTADQVGLYHFTTQTNQIEETNSTVDIGYHYVATDDYGNALDVDGDGIPDYGEDVNGDGIFGLGDLSDWQDYFNGRLPNLTITSGNNQIGNTNTTLSLPLKVKLADTNGLPLVNAPLNFTVTGGGAQIAIVTNGTFVSSISLRTGTDGQASVWFLVPAGMTTNVVTVGSYSGTNLIQTNFIELPIVPFETAPMLAVGGESLLTLTAAGNLFALGGNESGELGDYTYLDSTNPLQVVGLTNIVRIASSATYSLAIGSNGQLWSWGQLDAGSATNIPVMLCGMTNIVAIAAHADRYFGGSSNIRLDPNNELALSDPAVAVKSDGTVWMWGSSFCDDYGPAPVQIMGLSNAVAVAAGNCQTFAVTADGSVWEWGQGSPIPYQIIGLSNVVNICAGDNHTLALTSDGYVFAWGDNYAGELGDGGVEWQSDTPVMVLGLTNVTAIAAGSVHSLALDASGRVWAWGSDSAGQLGDDGMNDQSLPLQVLAVSNVVAIAAGSDASVAMTTNGVVWQWGSSDTGNTSWLWGDEMGDPQLSPVYTDFYNGQLPNLTITNGNNQVVSGNSEFPDPLVFQVTDANGLAVSNAPVSVEIVYGDMELRTNSGGTNFKGLRLNTDTNGEVSLIGFSDDNLVNTNCLIRVLAASGARVAEADFTEILAPLPTITITNLTDGEVVLIGTNQTLTIAVDAEAAAGASIQEVDYNFGTSGYADTLLGNSTLNPYTFVWTNTTWWSDAFVGHYTLSAVAIDNLGGHSDPSPSLTVTIALDADGNGLPDYWEVNYFGANGLDPNSSPNGNGQSLLYDYQNQLDPTDYYNSILPHLETVDGNDQDGQLNAFLPQPVIVKTLVASTQYNAPFLTNAPVQFTVTSGTALLAASNNDTPTNSIVLRSDTNGEVLVWVYFPSGGLNPPDSTILATAFSGGNSVSTTINEFVPMAHWTFNNTNTWIGEGGQLPVLNVNLLGIPSWSSNAVLLDATSSTTLSYNVVETNGTTNLTYQTGSLRFWFKPDWSSTNVGGNGPGAWGRLIEIGSYSDSFTNGWWSLYVNPAGTQIFLGTSTNGAGMTNLIGNIGWYSNEWYQIALTYSSTQSAVYVDGQLLASGAGITYLPNNSELTNGFRIGSDQNGNNQAGGAFDELETFNYYLDASNTYTHETDIPDWWEIKYFNETGLSPESDPASNGLNLLTYYSYGTDPNLIAFSLSGAKSFINTNVIFAHIDNLVGIPARIAMMIDYSNTPASISNMYGTTLDFSTATWKPFDTNIVATLTSGDGPYDIWVGLRGQEPNSTTTWEPLHVILDTVPPTITITNPAANIVSQPIIQLQGFANKTLSSLTYDVSNAAGILTNQTGYLTGQYYDTNLTGFTTNYFQCYDILTATNGANTITLHAIDLAGNMATTNFTFSVDYSGKTNPPSLRLSWPTNGTIIGAAGFTLKGMVDDPTTVVTATIVDRDGNTNSVLALVERSGVFIGNGLPLSSGTNTVTITAIDVVGNGSVTNFTVIGNDIGLVINPLSSNQLNQASINVTGSIGDPSHLVIVNGVSATVNSDGTWEADGVQVADTGTAHIEVDVQDDSGNPIASQNSFESQPATIDLMSFIQHTVIRFVSPFSPNDEYVPFFNYWPLFENDDESINWNYQSGGYDVGNSAVAAIVGFYFSYTYGYPYTNYYQFNNFLPGANDVTNGNAFSDSVPWQNTADTQTRVMVVPPDQAAIGTTATYLVLAKVTEKNSGKQLPASLVQFVNQALNTATADVTNTDGSVWSEGLVSVIAGALVEVTPKAPGSISFGKMQVSRTKEDWQTMISNEIAVDNGLSLEYYHAANGFSVNRKYINAVYAFYQKVYLEQPTEYYWAGLAKLAGAPVYGGLSDAQYAWPTLASFQQTLTQMNIDILKDLAWQFEAYRKGGLDALEQIYAVDSAHTSLDLAAITAWRNIDNGIHQNDQGLVLEGNKALLQREQQQILALGYSELSSMTGITSVMSVLAKCPVWDPSSSEPYYLRDFDSVMTYVVNQSPFNIAVFNDRWAWITAPTYGIWDTWVNLSLSDKINQVSVPLRTRAATYSFLTLY